MKKVAIAIPTYNAGETLNKLLESIINQNNLDMELYIIDSSSKDDTVEISKKYTNNVYVIDQAEFDHGGTRDYLLKKINDNIDIVIFVTQDIVIEDPNCFSILINSFQDEAVGVAFGRQLPHYGASFFAKQIRAENYPEMSLVLDLDDKDKYGFRTFFSSNSFAAYNIQLLKKVGGFKKGLISSEDSYAAAMLIKNGYKKSYVAEACVRHSHNYTIIQEFKRYFDIGVFYKSQSWLTNEFGKPQKAGVKYVFNEIKQILRERKPFLIFESFFRNLFKFVGYKLGNNFHRLPLPIIESFSMHKFWWRKK